MNNGPGRQEQTNRGADSPAASRILIIQENGRHARNRRFRECFCLQRAFAHLGVRADVWGKGHSNFKLAFDDLVGGYDAVVSLENYDSGWHPDLSRVKIPTAFWCIDAHMGVERYLAFVRRNRFDIVFNATEHFVEHFKDIAGESLWLPNAYDGFLIDRMFIVAKTIPLGFCGNVVNRRAWIDHLKHKWGLHHDRMVIGPDMVRAVNSYQIHWNLNVANDINYRTFETLGCGTFLLTNHTPGLEKLFTPGKHLDVYHDQKELDEKIAYYRGHPDIGGQIARRGYRHVRGRHQYLHRAGQILKSFGISAARSCSENDQAVIDELADRLTACKQYLFVSGATKSGTTLMAQVLSRSNEISFIANKAGKLEEGQWVQNLYEWGNGDNSFSRSYHMTEKHCLANRQGRLQLFRMWSNFWDLSKPVLADKSPHHVIKSRFLQALFPACRFIFLIRNGIVYATGEALQEKMSPLQCCRNWVNTYQLLLEDLPRLKKFLIVRYEDMANNADETFERIWRFLEVNKMPVANQRFRVPAFANGIQRREFNPIKDMNLPHVKNFLSRFDVKLQREMLQICTPIMDIFGYSTVLGRYREYVVSQDYEMLLTGTDGAEAFAYDYPN